MRYEFIKSSAAQWQRDEIQIEKRGMRLVRRIFNLHLCYVCVLLGYHHHMPIYLSDIVHVGNDFL